MPKTILVPFDKNGSLMHWADPRNSGRNGLGYVAAEWRQPEEFYARLTLTGMESGRSAKYLTWTDEDGRGWPMFVADLIDLLQSAIVAHGVARGMWIPRKRGQNFGLRYAGPDLRRGSSD